MKVYEIMSTELETISPDSSIKTAAKKMNRLQIGALVVSTPGFELLGIITERDMLRAFAKSLKPSTEVKKLMTKGVITIEHKATLEKAADKMIKYAIKRLVVTKNGECVGIVTLTDLITYESRLVDKLSDLIQTPKKVAEAG